MKIRKTLLSVAVVVLVFAFLTASCLASVADFERKKVEAKEKKLIAVGSYGGYWGLNDYFMGLMSKYFTLDEMKKIDEQIQLRSGIAEYSYNYMRESGNGYLYDAEKKTWTFTGHRVGKHYNEIYDRGFMIDIETGEIEFEFSSRALTRKRGYRNYSGLVGKKFKIKDTSYQIVGARNWSPIILDLDYDGVVDTNRNKWTPHAPRFFAERTAYFDLTGDERIEFCEWLGAKDGLLVKPNPDGTITGANNLFGTAGGYRDGYEKMSLTLDADRNGWVEGEELEGLFVWKDLNENAQCDAGELVSLSQLGIEKISTSHKNFRSVYVRNGREHSTWDWWPTGYELMRRK